VESGESDEAALARECREELDVELKVGAQLWSAAHVYDDVVVELVLYEAQIISGKARALSAQRLDALTIEEMQRLPFCEADIPLLAALAARTQVSMESRRPQGC
jgi:8-oxo-dGTP diphosphatase